MFRISFNMTYCHHVINIQENTRHYNIPVNRFLLTSSRKKNESPVHDRRMYT